MAVDELDTRILRLLLEQPRTSVREYARVLGIARGTLQARLDRLERDGVITGTGPSLSPAALGHPVRLRLLQQVLTGASTVHELTQIDGVGTSGQVYHHLRQLTSAGWLHAVGGGRHEVPVARVVPLLVLLLGAQR